MISPHVLSRRLLLSVSLLLAMCGPVSAVHWQDENHVDGFPIQFPESQIRITNVYADGVEEGDTHVALPETCVIYVNDGPKPVAHLQFDFAAVSADGTIGIPEPYDTTGRFAVGVLQNSGNYNCRLSRFGQVVDGQLRQVRLVGRLEVYRLVAWVDKVVYADGTTWTAPPLVHAPPLPLPTPLH